MSDLQTINLLLIENDPDDAHLIKTALSKSTIQFFNITEVCTCTEGLKILSTCAIHVILLDLNLPDIQCLETIKDFLDHNYRVPIVVISDFEDEALMIELVKGGIQDYLVKGMVNERMLSYFIRSSIERHKLAQKQNIKEENIRTVVENNADGILIIDQKGNVQFSNPAATCIFGRSLDQLVGVPFGFPLVEGESTELEIIRPDGSIVIVEARVSETTWEGERATQVSLRDITVRVNYQKELQAKLSTDALTGLYNRRGLIDLANYHMKLATRCQYPLMLIFFDMDGLKQINDNFGHAAGDQAIIATATILKNIFRETDIIVRLSGDEFVVLAINANRYLVEIVANRINEHVSAFNKSGEHPFQLSISWGYCYSDYPHTSTIEELLQKADASMYTQKMSKKR